MAEWGSMTVSLEEVLSITFVGCPEIELGAGDLNYGFPSLNLGMLFRDPVEPLIYG